MTPVEVQETSCSWYRDDKKIKVSSSDRTFWTVMKNRGYEGQMVIGGEYMEYLIPINALTIRKRKAIGKKRNLSPEERERRRQRMIEYHRNKAKG